MIMREHKTIPWDDDIRLTEQITSILKPSVDDPAGLVEIIRNYCSDRIETYSDPSCPERDGYGNKEIWLQTEQAIRQQECSWISQGIMRRTSDVFSTSDIIVIEEVCQYSDPDSDKVWEQTRIVGLQVYNGKIAGGFTLQDAEPYFFTQAKKFICHDIISGLNDNTLDKSELYMDYKLKRSCSWEDDAETAKRISANMGNLYLSPEENWNFMHSVVAENVLTITCPPLYVPRDGYGSREVWLVCERGTRRQNQKLVGTNQYLKHVTPHAVGANVIMEEDRVYRNPDGTLYYMRGFGTVPIVDGKMSCVSMWIPLYPPHVLSEKIEIFREAIAELPDSHMDQSMCPYLIEDFK